MLKNIQEQEQACALQNVSSSSTCFQWRRHRQRQRALTPVRHTKQKELKRNKKGNGEEVVDSVSRSDGPGVAFYYPL